MEKSIESAKKLEEVQHKQDTAFQAGSVLTISTGHAIHDTFSGFLPPMLPVLIEKFALSNTQAGLLSMFLQIPSLIQPWIGRIADRANLQRVVFLAPALTSIVMSLLGVAPGFTAIVLLLLVAGISSASFHSVAPVIAGKLSGNRLGRGMSFWMVGGEVGRVLGPLVVVTVISYFGLQQLPRLIPVGLFASVLLYFRLKSVPNEIKESKTHQPWKPMLKKMVPIMLPLMGIIVARSFSQSMLATYLPTFLTQEGSSLWLAGASLAVYELAGVAGAFLGGSLSDRLGRRNILVISLSAAPVLMFLFYYLVTHNIMVLPILLILGFVVLLVNPIIMALVQEQFPENRAFANGIYMAMSFALRSGVVVLVGAFGDWFGLRTSFLISTGILLLGVPFVFLLPRDFVHQRV